jgi:hypothetical protein
MIRTVASIAFGILVIVVAILVLRECSHMFNALVTP